MNRELLYIDTRRRASRIGNNPSSLERWFDLALKIKARQQAPVIGYVDEITTVVDKTNIWRILLYCRRDLKEVLEVHAGQQVMWYVECLDVMLDHRINLGEKLTC